MGKYLKKIQARLNARIKQWESAGANYQHANRKPGSEKK